MLNTAVSEYFRIKENTVNNACKLSQTISEAKLLKMDDTNDTLSKNIEVEMNSKDRLESYYGISVMNVEVESEVLYEAHHGDMDLYEVASFDTTSLQEYTAPITGTSSSPKWYYLRFYHYWSSPQTLNFSYKIS